jgi:hypothetical protein
MLRASSLFALVSILTSTACAGAGEHAIIGEFFTASRLRDNTALDNVATVVFDPQTQGTVTTFSLQSLGAERRRPLPLKSLTKALADAKAENAAFTRSEAQLVDISINAGRTAIDVAKYDGELVARDVTVAASVRMPDGATVQKTLVLTLQRAVLKGQKELTGRWVVTGVTNATP